MAEIMETKVRQAGTAPEPFPRQPEAARGDREGGWQGVPDVYLHRIAAPANPVQTATLYQWSRCLLSASISPQL